MSRAGAPVAARRRAWFAGAIACAVVVAAVFGCGDDSTGAGGNPNNSGTGGKTGTGGKGTGGKGGKGGTGGSKGGSGGAGAADSGSSGGSDASVGTGGTGATEAGNGGTSPGGADSGPKEAGKPSLCGNGKIDPGEQCDDGNTLDEDGCTSACTDNHLCEACLANNCPYDPTLQPRCSDFADAKSKDACYRTYACLVRTQCYLQSDPSSSDSKSCVTSALYCYCGDADNVTCKDGNGTGPCKAEIDAAFTAAPGDLPVVDSNSIVNNFGDVLAPAGAALSVLQCAHDWCGCPSNAGQWECSPSKHATAGKDAQ